MGGRKCRQRGDEKRINGTRCIAGCGRRTSGNRSVLRGRDIPSGRLWKDHVHAPEHYGRKHPEEHARSIVEG